MLKIFGAKARIGAAIVGLVIGAASGPAAAVIYRGAWDPNYGAPFDDLSWSGELEVVVPDTCLPTGAGTVYVLGCSGMHISSTTVELRNKNSGALLQTMNFGAAQGAALNGLNWALSFDAHQNLTGAKSTAFAPLQGLAANVETDYNGTPAWFSLQFLGDYAQLYWFDKEPGDFSVGGFSIPDEVALSASGVCQSNGVTIVPAWLAHFVNPDHCGWSDPDEISKNGAFITFSRVPEPSSASLVAAALAMLGLAGVQASRRAARRR